MAVARLDAIRSIGFASIGASYSAFGAPLTHNWRVFKITNNTNGDLLFSFDGATDNIFIPAGGFTLYDLATNTPPQSVSDNFVLELTTQFYVKYTSAPTSGSVYVEGVYARGT